MSRPAPSAPSALRASFVLALGLALGACTHKIDITSPGGGGGGGGGGPVVDALVTPANVQAVFDAHCTFCHGGASPSAGQNLGSAKYSYANLVRVPANEDSTYLRVLPGDAANSYVVMKLTGDPRIHGGGMPLGAPPLDAPTLAVVTGWINAGAKPDSIFAPPAVLAPLARADR